MRTDMELSINRAIKQVVEAHLGLGIVFIHMPAAELESEHVHVLKVQDFPILRHRYVVQREGERLSPVAQAFKDFVLRDARKFIRLPDLD